MLESASGVWARDRDGREYLDLFAGILTTSLGHCHPEVVDAIATQARTLGHVSTLYVSEPQIDAARHLAEIAPGRLSSTFFTNSGTEAIETAVMLACLHTGRSEILTPRLAYSGRSVLATNLTGQAPWRPLAVDRRRHQALHRALSVPLPVLPRPLHRRLRRRLRRRSGADHRDHHQRPSRRRS